MPRPVLPRRNTPLQKFIVPHLSTNALVSFSSPFPLCPLFDSSVIVPHMSRRVYGTSANIPMAAAVYRFLLACDTAPAMRRVGWEDARYARVAKPSEEVTAHVETGRIPDS